MAKSRGSLVWYIVESILLGATILAGFAAAAKGAPPDPAPVINFSQAPFCHNMKIYKTCGYSGRFALCEDEWGVYALNSDTKAYKREVPVATVVNGGSCPGGTSYQPAHHKIAGDCYESATFVAASPGTPKWVVITGTPPMCKEIGFDRTPGQIQVLRLDGALGLRYVGEVFDTGINRVGAEVRIDGDKAYVHKGRFSTDAWDVIDLNTLTKTGETTSPPSWTPQTSIDGFTYDVAGVIPNPVPVPFCGPCSFVATRSGGAVASPSPSPAPPTPLPICPTCVAASTCIPTASKTPTRTATKTKTATRTATPCAICTPTPTPHFGTKPTP